MRVRRRPDHAGLKMSFFLKLLLGNLLLVAVIVVLGGIASYGSLQAHHRQESQAYQNSLSDLGCSLLNEQWPMVGERVDQVCKRLRTDLVGAMQIRITVMGVDGVVLGDSDADPAEMENHRTTSRPEVLAAMAGRDGTHVRLSETLGIEFRYVARPIRHQGQVAAVFRTAMPVRDLARRRALLATTLFRIAAEGILVAIVLGLLISWIWYAPLRQITLIARRIAGGDLSGRARISGSRELAQLGTALNEMRDSLARQIELIKAQRENLRTVVSNLQEGVVALSGKGEVVLINQSARRLLGVEGDDAVGQRLQRIVRVSDVIDLYADLANARGPLRRQIEIDRQGRPTSLDVHAATVPAGASDEIRALIVVRDVTEIARTASVKAQFAANASHELRTPLATIRAAVDSLAVCDQADPDELAKLTGILDRQVTRLEHMTNDLLDLHAVESGNLKLTPADLTLAALADWVRMQFGPIAEERDVVLEVSASDKESRFRSDRKLLELIAQNLVDNALKFTPAGGEVGCRLDLDADGLSVTVSDTGCGIAPEDQQHVFDRFYQVDPSRSGDARTRGTGLGLAIVKHAAECLDGAVDLQSKPGHGTTITVRIPRVRA